MSAIFSWSQNWFQNPSFLCADFTCNILLCDTRLGGNGKACEIQYIYEQYSQTTFVTSVYYIEPSFIIKPMKAGFKYYTLPC